MHNKTWAPNTSGQTEGWTEGQKDKRTEGWTDRPYFIGPFLLLPVVQKEKKEEARGPKRKKRRERREKNEMKHIVVNAYFVILLL